MENYQHPETVQTNYDFLKRYLQYAASLPDPVLSPEAATMLSEFWLRMIEQGIAANRSFDSLVRMAKAHARLHLYTEIDPQIVNEITTHMQLMLVKMGRRIDPSVADPRDLAYNEIIQYVNTLENNTHITFREAAKHVCDTDNSVKQYMGGTVWAVNSNKKLRAVHDRFTNGGTDKPKAGRGGLAVTITNLNPLTLLKAAKQQQQEQTKARQNGRLSDNEEKESVPKWDASSREAITKQASLQQQKPAKTTEDMRSQGSHGSHGDPQKDNNVIEGSKEIKPESDLSDLTDRDQTVQLGLKTNSDIEESSGQVGQASCSYTKSE
jgi:MCM AAA-lid domain